MGRYDFAPQRVHSYASQLLSAKRLPSPPPWYDTVARFPPSERLVRPPLQRSQKPGQKPGKKASRLFKPLRLQYQEDRLRWEYFNDHPWELARPRVVLENDGKDSEKWDWSVPLDHSLNRPRAGEVNDEGVKVDEEWDRVRAEQSGRPITGESVILRQNHLLRTNPNHTPSSAYNVARREHYHHRHAQAIEQRVAREEALSVGAFFGLGPLDIGMQLEDKEYEGWRKWAEKEIQAAKTLQGSAYTGTGIESGASDGGIEEPVDEAVQELAAVVPGSRRGQEALGGAVVHP